MWRKMKGVINWKERLENDLMRWCSWLTVKEASSCVVVIIDEDSQFELKVKKHDEDFTINRIFINIWVVNTDKIFSLIFIHCLALLYFLLEVSYLILVDICKNNLSLLKPSVKWHLRKSHFRRKSVWSEHFKLKVN